VHKKKRNPIIPKSVCDVAKNNFPCNYEFELLLKDHWCSCFSWIRTTQGSTHRGCA
ncbi:BnaCnng78000D, partial [Brassica napus]